MYIYKCSIIDGLFTRWSKDAPRWVEASEAGAHRPEGSSLFRDAALSCFSRTCRLVFLRESWHGGLLPTNHCHQTLMMPQKSSKQAAGVTLLSPPLLCRRKSAIIKESLRYLLFIKKIIIPLILFYPVFWLHNYQVGQHHN